MLGSWSVGGVTQCDFGWSEDPLVQWATWQGSDMGIGVVLANFVDLQEHPRVELEWQCSRLYLGGQKTEDDVEPSSVIDLEMQPRSLGLIEVE